MIDLRMTRWREILISQTKVCTKATGAIDWELKLSLSFRFRLPKAFDCFAAKMHFNAQSTHGLQQQKNKTTNVTCLSIILSYIFCTENVISSTESWIPNRHSASVAYRAIWRCGSILISEHTRDGSGRSERLLSVCLCNYCVDRP